MRDHFNSDFQKSRSTPKLLAGAFLCVLATATAAADDVADVDDADASGATELAPVDVTSTPGASYISGASVAGKEVVNPREIPQSVSVITHKRIEEQALVTVADALNQVTGVTVISNDTTQSQYRVRGYSLGVSHDGIPAYNQLSGYQQLDLSIYEQVEVLRGPSGLFQGTGEPGGTVNLVRKRAKKEFAASADLSAGSWDNYGLQADVTGSLNESGSVRARAVVSGVDRDYFYDRTHTRKKVGYGTVEWDITPVTTLSLAYIVQDAKTRAGISGLPAWSTGELLGISRSTNVYPDWNNDEWKTQDYIAELTHRFDSGWKATAKVLRRDQDYYYKDGYPTTGVSPTQTLNYSRRVRDYDYKIDSVDVYLSGPFNLFGQEHRAVLGYNEETRLSSYKGANGGAVTGVPFGRPDLVPNFSVPYDLGSETEYKLSGVYGQLRLKIADPLTVIAGARVSDYRQRSHGISPGTPSGWTTSANKTNDEVTPYGGVVFDLNKQISLYASYSDIFIPQAQDKSGGGTLDPRIGAQYEIGSKGEFFGGKLNASIALFNLRDTNRAYEDPNNPGFYLNAGEVESKGWEAEVVGSPVQGLDIQAGYTRLDTKYLKDRNNKNLPFTTWEPKHTFKLWGVYHFERAPLSGLNIGVGGQAVSGSKSGTGSSAIRKQGGYAVVNALVSYNINKNLSLALNANNIFDRTYYTRLGGLNTYNTYGEPRNFKLTLRTRF